MAKKKNRSAYRFRSFHGGRVTFRNINTGSTFSFNLLGLILALILFASVFVALRGFSTEKTFAGFLNMLSTLPVVPLDFLIKGFSITIMPEVPILGEIITFLWSTIVFVGFIVSGLINVIVYIITS